MNTTITISDERPGRAASACCRRILVVEDEAGVRQLSTLVLESAGYEVDAAEDGAMGWEALHSASYDLLVTDNQMPKLSGIDLIAKLRSTHILLPVVLACGSCPVVDERLQLSALLPKPFTPGDLVETVKTVLHHSDNDMPAPVSEFCAGLPRPRAGGSAFMETSHTSSVLLPVLH